MKAINNSTKLILIGLFVLLYFQNSKAQFDTLQFADKCFSENIKTVLAYRKGWELSSPLLFLNSSDKIQFSFDDLDLTSKNYYYTILHYDSEGKPSDLNSLEYIEGFAENPIENRQNSFNTYIKYLHFSFEIPNENCKPLLSGNYLLVVWDENNKQALLTKRFYIIEENITIQASVKRSALSQYRNTHQNLNFTINSSINLPNPQNDLKVVILQNYRTDNAKRELQPQFIQGNSLLYNFDTETLFAGGNEFRHVDMKSYKFKADGIDSIYFQSPTYHYQLLPDVFRTFNTYSTDYDINGKRLVKLERSTQSEIDADYYYLHFLLPTQAPLVDADIFVIGELTNWNMSEENVMKYNYYKRAYELTLLVKQGYYNYQYLYKRKGFLATDISFVEGNHYETENDYYIFVYYHNPDTRYDQLIGYWIANTNGKKTN